MIKRLSAILLVMAAGLTPVFGQTPESLEMDKTSALWFNSTNAAGMTLTSIASFEAVDVSYNIADGNYRRYTDGNQKTFAVSAEGSSSLGGGKVWGRFSYNNLTDRDTKFNAMFLNLDEDNPFFVADEELSWWKKQKYELEAKASTPVLWNHVVFGVDASYYTESGAKQIDPRGYGSEYGLVVKPAALFTAGRHSFGLALDYEKGNMRMTPINNAYMNSKTAFIMHGLGNSEATVISLVTSGVGQVFDKKNQYGGSVQYGFTDGAFKVLADFRGSMRAWEFSHTPNRPELIGSTNRMEVGGKIQLLHDGDKYLHAFVVDGSMKNTNGIEYIQVFNKDYEVQQYETVGQNVKSKYSHNEALVSYDIFRKGGESFNWTAGASVEWYCRNDRYLIPESSYNCSHIYAEGHGRKQFSLRKVALTIGAKAGYCLGMDGDYTYTGSSAKSVIVTEYFPHELEYQQASWWCAGADLNVTFPISAKTRMFVGAEAEAIKTNNTLLDRRNIAFIKTGFIF